jgi:hypothetical protein
MLKTVFWLLLGANIVLFGFNAGYWGPKAQENHEPQRLVAQLNVDKLHLLAAPSPVPASAPVEALTEEASAPVPAEVVQDGPVMPATVAAPSPAPATAPATAVVPAPTPISPQTQTSTQEQDLVCLEFAYFNTDDAQKFDAALSKLALKTRPMHRNVEEIVSYMVHIPTTEGRVEAERKAAELRRFGVTDFYVIPGTYAIASLRWNVSLGVFKTERAAKSFVDDLTGKGVKGLRTSPRKSGSVRRIYQLREVDTATRSQLEQTMKNFTSQKMSICQ